MEYQDGRDDPDPEGRTLTPEKQERVRSILEIAPANYRMCLLKMINEMLKRDTQIHTPEASIDQSNPALGDNTGCESATHVLTGQLDAPIPDAPIPQEVDLSELVPAWFDLLKVRKLVQQITQHADPCQIEDTWAVTSKNLQAAQNRFIQASKLVETSPWCLHMLAHVIRTGPFPPDKEGHEEKMGEELVKRGLKKKVMD